MDTIVSIIDFTRKCCVSVCLCHLIKLIIKKMMMMMKNLRRRMN